MSINHVLLGVLSGQSCTGYELKKIMQDSPLMPWSGNNNQIYKSLVELHDRGLVTSEIQHQESSPTKKRYTITVSGLAELKQWVLGECEAPTFRKLTLLQLQFSDQLSDDELESLLRRYEDELEAELHLHQEKSRRAPIAAELHPRSRVIHQLIHENVASFYIQERQWVQRLRLELSAYKEENNMNDNNHIVEKDGVTYLDGGSAGLQIRSEQDLLDIIAVCWEHGVERVLLHADGLAEDFYKLRTGLAGAVLQKLINYRLKTAFVLPQELVIQGRASEMLTELNRGASIRAFAERAEAEQWLLG
ncbi:DNA-binding PadR family transcriptional regulator [Paenibacillus phyllosphaerae]|uniref:DNA-binding PadR family transcriptional regulator n=1 Tax=Paenibacillus phyllosphaerae TaxID=274593 RepID=A0A7W5FMG6_9BACL|nr:DUF4180 domain-containing protein [Paenibacillus phyllosphaerae]MBB3110052.1 DNA-binding PadR family transcriptional regulator [Paenibacillus phyllosphaerae]